MSSNGTLKDARRASRILLVDDDKNILSGFTRQLRGKFDVVTASSGSEALELVATGDEFSVIVSDMRMPGMTGVELLEQLKEKVPNTVRMMLTGNADIQTAIDAINTGNIFRFFSKPCPGEILIKGLEDGIKQHNLIVAERELLEQTLTGSIKVFIDILSLMDPVAYSRAAKIRDWTRKVARSMGFPSPWQVDLGAMLSQIGAVAIPPEIIEKKRSGQPMSTLERDMFVNIPETGRNLLQNIPRMEEVAKIVYYQNKGFDGSGFPNDSVSGKGLPMGARLLKILLDLEKFDPAPQPTARSFLLLDETQELYDPLLLSSVRETFVDHDNIQILDEQEVLEYKVVHLQAGFTLISDIELTNGKLILAKGAQLSETQVERLRNIAKIQDFKEPVKITLKRPEKDTPRN